MKMKMILPMMLIAALPLGADAQNKSGLVMSILVIFMTFINYYRWYRKMIRSKI